MWRHPGRETLEQTAEISAQEASQWLSSWPAQQLPELLINLVCESTDIYDRMGQMMNLGFGGFGPFIGGVPWAPPAGVTGTDDAYVVLTVNMPKSEAAKPRKFEITG